MANEFKVSVSEEKSYVIIHVSHKSGDFMIWFGNPSYDMDSMDFDTQLKWTEDAPGHYRAMNTTTYFTLSDRFGNKYGQLETAVQEALVEYFRR